MKIGILTFHCALNYGAVLQCHGLYRTLEGLGHRVEVVDYRPPYLYYPRQEVRKRMWLTKPIKAYKLHKETSYNRKLYDKFFEFQRKNWKLTKSICNEHELKEVTDIFDIIIVGSDQVWSPQLNGGDSAWYGFPNSKAKWITYAASAGDACFSDVEKKKLNEALNNFTRISVREEKLADYISEICPSIQASVVLDPTLLASPELWKDWSEPVIKGDYIVIYQARENDNTFRVAEELKNQMNIENVVVLDNHSNVKRLGYEPYCASPSEFVSIVRNASLLVTTSFHGTAFAIITETPFVTLKLNDGADERSENLLGVLGLSELMIDCNSEPTEVSIDFTMVGAKVNELRESSICYLNNI